MDNLPCIPLTPSSRHPMSSGGWKRVGAMRCLPCGAEMDLMHVVQDKTISVRGYEHRTFKCSACGDIERRLVFAKDSKKSYAEPMLVYTAPHISAAPTGHKERITGSGILRRIFGILRVLCQSSRSSEPVLVRPATPTSLRPAEPAPAPTITPLVPSEASNDLDGLDKPGRIRRDGGRRRRRSCRRGLGMLVYGDHGRRRGRHRFRGHRRGFRRSRARDH